MCVIVFKKENYIISEETLKQMWDQNPHGAGYMFNKKDKLIVVKGLMTFEKFYKAWKHHEHLKTVLHFRIKTYGEINAENTHPFYIKKHTLAIAHNGSMTMDKDFLNLCEIEKPDPMFSDTWHFANKALTKLPDNWWKNQQILLLLQNQAKYNKFILMDNTNRVTIINEKMGDWIMDKNVWVSNTSWQPTQSYQHSNIHSANNKWNNVISKGRGIKTLTEKEFTLEDGTQLKIPAGTMGYVTKFIERNKTNNKNFWFVKIYSNPQIPYQIALDYTFPYCESDLNLQYAN